MAGRPQLPLDWLDPTLDQCRQAIKKGVQRSWQKAGASSGLATVTDLDLEIEDIILAAIQDRFPNAAIVSEERHPDTSVLNTDACFVVDPIDGTQELLAGRREFGISVALLKDGKPEAAVLDFPALDRRFAGASGMGVWLGPVPVVLRRSQTVETACIVVSATQRRAQDLQPTWASMKVGELRPVPAFTPKFEPLLLGECDAAVHLPVDDRETFVWDYAAAAILLSQAGGHFITWAGADILRRLPPVFQGGWIAAVSSELGSSVRHGLGRALHQVTTGHGTD